MRINGKQSKYSFFNKFLDFVFIIISAVGSLSIIRYVTYDIVQTSVDSFIGLSLYSIILYLFRFGFSFRFTFIRSIPNKKLFSLLCVIYLWEAFQCVINGIHGKSITYFCFLVYLILVSEYLFRLYKERLNIVDLVRPYVYYSLYNTLVIVLSAILILLGILSRFDVPLELPIFEDNISKGYSFYFPGYLSVVGADSRLLSMLGIPTFCGLSHEPHVLCYTIFPAVFLTIYYFRISKFNKVIFLLQLFVLIFVVTSATAVLCFIVIFIVHQIWNFFINKEKRSIIFVIILIPILLYFAQTELFSILSSFLEDKTSGGETTNYSQNLLKYVFSPTGMIGYGINPPITIADGVYKNIGLVSSMLIIAFYIYMLTLICRNIFSRNLFSHYVGLACLYFACHSLKLSVLAFNYSYIVYLVIILSISDALRRQIFCRQG